MEVTLVREDSMAGFAMRTFKVRHTRVKGEFNGIFSFLALGIDRKTLFRSRQLGRTLRAAISVKASVFGRLSDVGLARFHSKGFGRGPRTARGAHPAPFQVRN